MAVSAERRKEVQDAIRARLAEGVSRGDGVKIAADFPDVPKSTILRWYQSAVAEAGQTQHAQARAAVSDAKQAARESRRRKGPARATPYRALKASLPTPVTPETINPMAARTAIDQVRVCIQHAETVVKYCTLEDGRIRNPRLYLQASNHMRASVESLAKIAERLNDAQRIEQVHKAIFEEIRACDPETAERILQRLQHLQETWGLR
jgi:hypothetical protein